jgi:hypothetical protein
MFFGDLSISLVENCWAAEYYQSARNSSRLRGRHMIFGLSLHAYTQLHVLISLVGIASGLMVLYGLLASKRLDRWTSLFLATTALTSVTGFGFPFAGVTPAIRLGVISLVALAIAYLARYVRHLAGGWRVAYVLSAAIALYLNVFVLIVQSFEKIPALKAIAPTQKEAPFAIAQLAVLVLFIGLTMLAVKQFHPASAPAAKSVGKAA